MKTEASGGCACGVARRADDGVGALAAMTIALALARRRRARRAE
jgi:MYXO-CTERM domain-containing protein